MGSAVPRSLPDSLSIGTIDYCYTLDDFHPSLAEGT